MNLRQQPAQHANNTKLIARLRALRMILAIGLAGSWIAGCVPPGARLLHMEVYRTNQLVLRTMFDAPDREGPMDFWRRAGKEPFASESHLVLVKADEENPLRATLTGQVQIKITHVDKVMTSATLTNLVLVRSTPESLKWHLAPAEVERVKQVAE